MRLGTRGLRQYDFAGRLPLSAKIRHKPRKTGWRLAALRSRRPANAQYNLTAESKCQVRRISTTSKSCSSAGEKAG